MRIYDNATNTETAWENLKEIIIYGSGKILFKTENHKLSEYRENKNGVFSETYNGDILGLNLSTQPKRALKENLTRKDNYYLKYTRGQYSWENGYSLYIHESEITVSSIGEKLAFMTADEKHYKEAYHFTFIHGAYIRRIHCERVPEAGPKWKIPDGGKWGSGYGTEESPVYDTFSPYGTDETIVIKKWTTREKIAEMDTAGRFYTRTEESNSRTKAREIAEKLNKNRVFYKDVSFYEIERLLKIYNLEEIQK